MDIVKVADGLTTLLKGALCAPLEVAAVPAGYAINTGFLLPDGDRLSFYLVADDDGRFHLEDDGATLPDAIASGLDLKSPTRAGLLRGLLAEEGARFDEDLAIRSEPFDESVLGPASLRFISALIRTRDLTMISRENVAASFADDVRAKLLPRLPSSLKADDNLKADEAVSPDIVLRRTDTGLKAARVYAAGADLRLMEALVDFQSARDGDSPVIAVVDRRRGRVSEKRMNAVTNRGLPIAVVDGMSDDWISRVISVAEAPNLWVQVLRS